VAWVRERTIPTERPPLVDEVSTNFWGYRVPRGQRNGYPRPFSRISRPETLLFLPSSSSVVLTRLSEPRSRLTTPQKIWYRWEPNPDPWIYSQEFWPLDHRSGSAENCVYNSYFSAPFCKPWPSHYPSFDKHNNISLGTSGSVIGWGNMLQAGRSRVQLPTRSLDFTIGLILSDAPWFSVRLTSLPPSENRLSNNVGASRSHNPTGLHGLLQE
jgi:hypothetical protein